MSIQRQLISKGMGTAKYLAFRSEVGIHPLFVNFTGSDTFTTVPRLVFSFRYHDEGLKIVVGSRLLEQKEI